ncbi:SWIM zinc finger family protein, partial [Streptomyces violascens]
MSDTYENERTFEPLPPAHGRGFATSWWGLAWLKALEDTALDGQQLKQGRRLAREGAVGAVTVRPGRITALVRDRDGSHHRSDVLLQELDEDDWDRFLAMAAERAGHIAALLDREMPPHLVEDATSAGVELLPVIGDLEPRCTCEAWDHCPHTAALCYRVARLLDQDPFVLLLMRGRAERPLLDALQERSAAPAVDEPGIPQGIPAEEAFAARDIVPPLPALPQLPPEPGEPPHLDTETAPEPGVDPAALEFLAADAAARAHRMLAEALASDHELHAREAELTEDQDTVRLAAACQESRISARLATASGRRPTDLSAAVRAWQLGGAASLQALEEEWTPHAEALARAVAGLDRAWPEGERPALRPTGGNRWT